MTTDEKIAILVDVLGRVIMQQSAGVFIRPESPIELLNMLAKIKDADNG